MTHRHDIALDRILDTNAGVITSAQAQAAGASRPAFADYVRRRSLERASRGVYIDPGTFPDDMVILQRRFPKAVFSHGTALYLFDMTDAEPVPLTVTVDSGYNAEALKKLGVSVHYAKPEWYGLGIDEVSAPSGAIVRAYNRERTVCDTIRTREKIDPAMFRQAIREYARATDKDLARLSAYAQAMGIEAKVREVMEVAL